MDTTVQLGPRKFSLRATIDHHGPSIHSGHYTASVNCCKNILLQRSHYYEFGITDNKTPSTAYVTLHDVIGRGTSAETFGLDYVFPPDDLGSSPEALC